MGVSELTCLLRYEYVGGVCTGKRVYGDGKNEKRLRLCACVSKK